MSTQSLSDLVRGATPSAGGSGGGPVPAGDYETIVSGIEPVNASTGSRGFKVISTITEGEFANKKLWDFIYFTANNVGISVARMIAYGASQDAVADALMEGNEAGFAIMAQQVIDTPVTLTVALDEYQGKTRNKIKFAKPGAAPANPLAAPKAPAATPAAAGARPTSPF